MSKKIRVDFFHDVICGWCYVLSARLRQLAEEFNLDIHHHAFALSATREEMIGKFGSMKQAKQIILGHWEQCARADDNKRVNVEGMRQQKFEYPFSTPGLVACKAAEQQGGASAYWNYFDAVTHAHMSENRNIGDLDELIETAGEVGLDKPRFLDDFASSERQTEIQRDRKLAQEYGITSTPTLIINKRWVVPGALDINALRETLKEIATKV
ncbi:DsbA family protein [Pseudoalteromonas sp. Scap03]|uniref:DsbA family oxidoreductase n=1 Tax=unclassified Pseudoalteromonas TaxID=194690 RepID=UPI0015BE88F0|nr:MULTISPECIES: DsbA family protein [unclassified Pseudoalteromonas]NWL16816.1 DsbA family protein [Pseudoalteromonas sp. Scap03]QLE81919.1 DsbA family protein [Pseudoalteromonas sp. Scap25]QLE89863.1 DsbA family protein [Pseudoalteromonas sp. Scap06]